jgi:TonB family protein
VPTEVSILKDPGFGLGSAAAAATRDTIFDDPDAEEDSEPETETDATVPPPLALRRYFRVVEFVLPEALREPTPEGPEPEDELTAMPEVLEAKDAVYPAAAREAMVEATVQLELDLDAQGQLEAVRPLSADPTGWGFELAAMEALWNSSFSPAMAGPASVPVRITYTYRFTLEERVVVTEAKTPEPGDAIDPDGPVNFSGIVRERGSRKPLADVEVIIEDLAHSTSTDDTGYFTFRGLPSGTFRVVASTPGYHRFETEEDILPGAISEVVYFLRETARGVPEIIVRARRERKEVTRRTIEIETIERIPGSFGDPVKVVQNLPGVSRSPFDFGLLLVRGSGPEDSGAHIDGIRVPQLFHFGGFRSIVTPILLDAIDFYPGGYGPSYGRLTGGILDIRTRIEYEDSIHGLVQTDLLDTSVAVTGPIKRKGERHPIGGFVLAARRSYLDVVLPILAPAELDLSNILFPQWLDVQGKLTINPNPKHSFSLLAYYSQDRAGTRVEDPSVASIETSQGEILYKNDFWRANFDWIARPSDKFTNRLTFAIGQDVASFGVGQFATVDSSAFWWILREEANLEVNEKLSFRFGTDIIASLYAFEFDFAGINISGDPYAEREALNLADSDFGFAPGVYAEAGITLADERVRLRPGLRFDLYTIPSQFTLTTLDPRFSYEFTPDPQKKIDIKGSVGLYHQNPQSYEILDVTGDTSLKSEQSLQVTLGTEIRFTDFLTLDIQGFYKRLERLVVAGSQSDVSAGGSDAAWSNSGDGHIYGAELFLRLQSWKNLEGWIALTLQRSKRRDRPDWDYYWYDFDQPVILDAVLSYKLPHGFRIGARWRYGSGNPETPVASSIYDSDNDGYLPINGPYNSERLPHFHALDIRIDKDFNFTRWKLTVYLDILNIYNRKNPEFTRFNFDYTEKTYLYGLPILPNLGIKAQF